MSDSHIPQQRHDAGSEANSKPPQKQESLLANLLINIVIPALILAKLSGDEWLGTKWAIVVALAFPLLYGLRDFLQNGRVLTGAYVCCEKSGGGRLVAQPQFFELAYSL